jgi:hypothetical protein
MFLLVPADGFSFAWQDRADHPIAFRPKKSAEAGTQHRQGRYAYAQGAHSSASLRVNVANEAQMHRVLFELITGE